MENNRKPPMPGPFYPPFSAGLVGDVQGDAYAAMLAAQQAQTDAETAQGKAEDAQEAAETAQGKAEDAQEAAETAQGAAEAWATGGTSGTPTATNNAKYYSEQAEAAAQTLVLDPTLTSPTQAAQAEAVGIVRDKLDAFAAGSAELPVDVGNIQEKYVNYSSGKITNTSETYGHVGFIKLLEGTVKVRYPRIQSTGSTDTYGIAFYSAADTSTYISGVKALRNAASTVYVPTEVSVPSGAKYVAFSVFKDTQTYGVPYLYAMFDNAVLDDVSELTSVVLPDALNAAQPSASGAISAEDGTVTSTTYYDHTDYIDVSGVSKIRYTRPAITGTTATSGMAFYDSSKAFISGVPNSTGNRATGWKWQEEAVPEGAAFARFGWWSASSKETYGIAQNFAVCDADDFDASLVGKVENLSVQVPFGAVNNPLNLHTLPENEGVLNVIKRCRQFTDFIWTPAVDLPRCDMDTILPPDTSGNQFYEGLFKAGVQYKGLPYGNCKNFFATSRYNKTDTFVGFGSTFSAFATAVRNADSIIGQESGYRTSPVRSLPFAAVCSSLACYALNVPYVETTDIPSITGMTSLGKIVNSGTRIDLNLLRLGDLVNEKGHHVSLITDIIRDRSGAVQYIEISEATTVGNGNRSVEGSQYGGLCRRIAFTVEDFFWRYAAYTLLRYSGIASVPYEKSPYVDVGDEIPMNPVLDLPVMPYEGEGFVYNAGYIPAASGLLISSTYYSHVRVFKDGAEIAASPFAIPADTALVAFETLGVADAGEYSAYLCNMASGANTDITTRCHWTVFTA